MPKINQTIPKQAFEVIRDQIATILKNELQNQAQLDSNFDEPEVYSGRVLNLSQQKLPAVNVLIDRGDYQNQSVKHQWGVYTYRLEFYHKAKAKNFEESSEFSSRKLEELIGRSRAILMHPGYYHLDVQNPTVGRRYFEEFTGSDPQEATDTQSVTFGYMNFVVEVSELQSLETPQVITESFTTVLVDDNDGYKWEESF